MTDTVTPEPEATYYGVPLTCIGEDGDMLAFGHYTPRLALAAFNRHARVEQGLVNVVDTRSATACELLGQITQGWGVFRKPRAEDAEDPDWEWVMDECAATDPHASPYTRLRLA